MQIECNGYTAIVKYDMSLRQYYGVVNDIPNTIGFYGTSLDDLKQTFESVLALYESALQEMEL